MAKRSSYPEVKVQVRDLVGVVGIVAPLPHGIQYSGKILFTEKPGVQDEGGRHVAKRRSDPRVAYPEVKVQVRDLVRVVVIVAPFAPRGISIWGKFV